MHFIIAKIVRKEIFASQNINLFLKFRLQVRRLDDQDGKRFLFEVYSEKNATVKGCKKDSKGAVVQGNHKTYRMSASSEENREMWVESITGSIREHPFYDIVSAKKLALSRKSLKHNLTHDIPNSSEIVP